MAFVDCTIFLSLAVVVIFCAFFYQTPGPVMSLVSTPERKSGIPQAVEIPAPVNAIKCLLPAIRSASSVTFLSRTSLESKYYFLSS